MRGTPAGTSRSPAAVKGGPSKKKERTLQPRAGWYHVAMGSATPIAPQVRPPAARR